MERLCRTVREGPEDNGRNLQRNIQGNNSRNGRDGAGGGKTNVRIFEYAGAAHPAGRVIRDSAGPGDRLQQELHRASEKRAADLSGHGADDEALRRAESDGGGIRTAVEPVSGGAAGEGAVRAHQKNAEFPFQLPAGVPSGGGRPHGVRPARGFPGGGECGPCLYDPGHDRAGGGRTVVSKTGGGRTAGNDGTGDDWTAESSGTGDDRTAGKRQEADWTGKKSCAAVPAAGVRERHGGPEKRFQDESGIPGGAYRVPGKGKEDGKHHAPGNADPRDLKPETGRLPGVLLL